jgi:hypothetical protein
MLGVIVAVVVARARARWAVGGRATISVNERGGGV